MKRLYLFFFFLVIFGVNGQTFSGKIIIEDQNTENLSTVFVTNITSLHTVKTETNVNFSIPSRIGDVIRFTSYTTERKDIIITKELLEKISNIIKLDAAYIEIDEIVLSKFKPTGHLKTDVLALEKEDKSLLIKKSIGLPEPKADYIPNSSILSLSNGNIGFGIEAIYDVISGNQKKKERLHEYEVMNSDILKIKNHLGDDYFSRIKIPNNLVDNFLQFVYNSDNLKKFVSNGKYEIIKSHIEKYLPIYRKRLDSSHLTELDKS